jgi:hypothetical protein
MKASKRRKGPVHPAPTVARHPETLGLEKPLREWVSIKKTWRDTHDPVLIVEAVNRSMLEDEPSSQSAVATGSIAQLDWWLDGHKAVQRGRTEGGRKTAEQRQKDAADDYRKIRKAVEAMKREAHDKTEIVAAMIGRGYSRSKVYRALRQSRSPMKAPE